MDDKRAFERRVAAQIQRFVGPVQPVDDAAIYAAISSAASLPRRRFRSWFRSTHARTVPAPATNGHTPTLRGRTQLMFSPAKVVAVGALLVAVGGLLAAQPHGPDIASAPASSPERGATAPAGPDITVVGVEYAFEGLPTSVPAGTSLGLRNEGTEVHELIVYRKNDGVTETWDEILALPEGQYNHLVRFIGNAYAEPGESSFEVVTVALEGDYFAVCLIRQGTTEFDGAKVTFPPDAVPHLLLGMGQGFTVTAAGSSRGPVPMGSSAPIAVGPTSSPAA